MKNLLTYKEWNDELNESIFSKEDINEFTTILYRLLPIVVVTGLSSLEKYQKEKEKEKLIKMKNDYFKDLDWQSLEDILNNNNEYQQVLNQIKYNKKIKEIINNRKITPATNINNKMLNNREMKLMKDLEKIEKEILPTKLYNQLIAFRQDVQAKNAV